ncbi:MAG: hypothetical protein EA395_15840 [Phormidium sp. GEM2.Bin31]|nr:hypothetical protein [Phormidium sp. BM_Day4_Bin.17]TVR05295.1 MAG: hypothetical protein EA395_15840 [Phormidium sp. GEM2.Bin31]UCJ13024.1 MAG: hypothetical protein JWS08_04325 [Phormidium sp. PBR-2020]
MNPIAKGLLASIGLSTILGAAVPVAASPFYPSRYRGGTLRDYETCTSQLLDVELGEELAAIACGTAFRPRDLSDCVSNIVTETDITATTALESCRQVRRPLDLATCTVGIAEATNGANLPNVLDSCRRSLLPERYANCVLGITNSSEVAPTAAMSNCLDATDRIRDTYPTFIRSR